MEVSRSPTRQKGDGSPPPSTDVAAAEDAGKSVAFFQEQKKYFKVLLCPPILLFESIRLILSAACTAYHAMCVLVFQEQSSKWADYAQSLARNGENSVATSRVALLPFSKGT